MARALLSFGKISPLAVQGGIAPGFDPNHIAATGALFSGVALPSGNFFDLKTAKAATVSGTPATAVNGGIGPAMNFAANADVVTASPTMPASPLSSTAAVIFVPSTAAPAVNSFLISMEVNNGNGCLLLQTTGVLAWNQAGGITGLTGATVVAGQPYFLAASAPKATGTAFGWVLVNLATGQIKSGTNNTAGILAAGTAIYVGNKGNSGQNRPALSKISAAMTGNNNLLSLPQLLTWAQDPWAFWYPHTFDMAKMLATPPVAAAFQAYWAQQANIAVLGTGAF